MNAPLGALSAVFELQRRARTGEGTMPLHDLETRLAVLELEYGLADHPTLTEARALGMDNIAQAMKELGAPSRGNPCPRCGLYTAYLCELAGKSKLLCSECQLGWERDG